MHDKNEIVPMVIDLNAPKETKLQESFLRMFGTGIEFILNSMLGGNYPNVKVKGTKEQVSDFVNTLARETKYITDLKKYGLQDLRTFATKADLDDAVKKFERSTGLIYPFK